MAERRTSYGLPELLASGNGDLLDPGRPQLPLPPLLMFERIDAISDIGGAHGRGQVIAMLPTIPVSTGSSPAVSGVTP